MNSIVRWNPTREMATFRRLFNDFDNVLAPSLRQFEGAFGMPLDVVENEDNFIVKASIPGINVDDINITLEDNVLTISGEVKSDETQESERYHIRERRYGSFSRSLNFRTLVNGDNVEASYENGILTLTVPKAEEVKPRRIEVKVK